MASPEALTGAKEKAWLKPLHQRQLREKFSSVLDSWNRSNHNHSLTLESSLSLVTVSPGRICFGHLRSEVELDLRSWVLLVSRRSRCWICQAILSLVWLELVLEVLETWKQLVRRNYPIFYQELQFTSVFDLLWYWFWWSNASWCCWSWKNTPQYLFLDSRKRCCSHCDWCDSHHGSLLESEGYNGVEISITDRFIWRDDLKIRSWA